MLVVYRHVQRFQLIESVASSTQFEFQIFEALSTNMVLENVSFKIKVKLVTITESCTCSILNHIRVFIMDAYDVWKKLASRNELMHHRRYTHNSYSIDNLHIVHFYN